MNSGSRTNLLPVAQRDALAAALRRIETLAGCFVRWQSGCRASRWMGRWLAKREMLIGSI